MTTSGTASDVFDHLGIRPIINGHHWRTVLGGSIMPPEVVQAMTESSGYFINVDDLHMKAGEYLARITGAEAGMVTAGCAAAQVLQAAACMTGMDDTKIVQLPDTAGMRDEIIIQKGHRNHYDNCYRIAGAKLVEIDTTGDTNGDKLSAAITKNTAAVAFAWHARFYGIKMEEVIKIAHSSQVPVIVDAAAELPPLENLTKFTDMGADLVAFSGGKGIRGPQSTGILVGKKSLVDSAFRNAIRTSMDKTGIGRPMKVCKEEIVGLVKALELFLEKDHEGEWAEWRSMSEIITDMLKDIKGLNVYLNEGPVYPGPAAPTATIFFKDSWNGPSPSDISNLLMEGNPPIYAGTDPQPNALWIAPVALQRGEEIIIAERLRKIFTDTQ